MSKRIDELKKAYREIEAPPHLATRIRAEVAEQPMRRHSWMPAGASVLAIALVGWLALFVGEQAPSLSSIPSKPSLTAIAALKPDAPANMAVSFSQLKTARKPKMPKKPRLNTSKPQTNLELERDLLEEKNDVLT